jgi:hypothetical protein
VLDGEIVVATDGGLDFEALQQCIHPAVSRVIMLGEKTPASFIAFDLLALGDEDYTGRPFAERSAALEAALADAKAPIHLTPTTTDLEVTNRWFVELEGAHLDGVIAKPLDGTYQPDKRVMFKIKHVRTADCVLAGFRWHKASTEAQPLVGSLLLGLFNDEQKLRHVGVVGCPATSAGGTPPGTCPSRRCAPNARWRSSTSTWKAPASGTWPTSSAGARTEHRSRAPTSSRSPTPSPTSCPPSGVRPRGEAVTGRTDNASWGHVMAKLAPSAEQSDTQRRPCEPKAHASPSSSAWST